MMDPFGFLLVELKTLASISGDLYSIGGDKK